MSTPGTATAVDHVMLYERCSAGFAARVAEIGDRWTAPTPLPGWDVRALVNHVVAEELWTPPLIGGSTIAQVGDAFDGDVLGGDVFGGDPAAAARAAEAGALAAITAAGALEVTVHLSFGDVPAVEYVMQVAADHLVHSWDLARGLGCDEQLDPAAVAAVLGWFVGVEDAYRAAGLVGPRVEITTGTPQDHLLARFGRVT
ncbi:TIGR03086 family metal-binding protein [Pseudonocardia sp. TRM90224]|uniref:TIGR03086 family metal-binding protein n=1 Tax=Pseudonocardia sp. TRM90224 TaxID=2812678 RepID=UPI001E35881A|nr:TIGR03086 family metal-binding protein [Pseudonocardia sp. TRM90224]